MPPVSRFVPAVRSYYSDMGTVGLNKERCIGCKECVSACPFEIPRYDQKSDKIYKCDLCLTRIQERSDPCLYQGLSDRNS